MAMKEQLQVLSNDGNTAICLNLQTGRTHVCDRGLHAGVQRAGFLEEFPVGRVFDVLPTAEAIVESERIKRRNAVTGT